MHRMPELLLLALWGGFVALLCGACTPPPEPPRTPYLQAATEVAAGLTALAEPQGPLPDEAAADTAHSASLGTGAGGRALFFLELFHATREGAYLTRAQTEADTMLASALAAAARGEARPGLYNGAAGHAFVLAEMDRISGENRYRDALPALVPVLAQAADGEAANDVIVGAAGVGLALLHLVEAGESDSLLAYATAIGDTLLHRGRPAAQGMYWTRAQDMEWNLPNFSHGTAGVGYYLARLYEVTRQQAYLDGAEAAARYLMDVADREGGLFLVPYGIPNEGLSTQYDIGWAHGPPGTARLFYLLWQLTGEEAYRAVVAANVQSLVASGLPGATRDSLRWTGPFRIDQRFGTAGAATFLLRLHDADGRADRLRLARAIVDDILSRSEQGPTGRHWVLPRYGFQGGPGEDASYTGYFYGAAGLGLALLEMHYAETDQPAAIVWPDSPFGERL